MSNQIRSLEVIDQIETDDDVIYVTNEGSWNIGYTWIADWNDVEAAMFGAIEAAKRGGEVVILEDGSDTYVIASTADKI